MRLSSSVWDIFSRTFGHGPFGHFRAITRHVILFGHNQQSKHSVGDRSGEITEEESRRHPMQSLQHLREHARKISLFRWVLLLWISFVYLWGILWGGGMGEQITLPALILFTLLMLPHISLYGASGFWPTFSQRFRFLYFAIQALLIVLISLVTHRFPVTLGL